MKEANVLRVRRIAAFKVSQNFAFFLLAFLSAVFGLIEPFFISKLLDQIGQADHFSSSFYFSVSVVILACLLRIILGYLKNAYMICLRNHAIKKVTLTLLEKVLHQQKQQLERTTPTYLVSRMIDDPLNLDGILNYSFIDSFVSLLFCCSVFGLMTTHSWLISISTLLFIVVDYVIAFSLPLTGAYKNYNESSAVIKSKTANLIQGALLIKLGDRYEAETAAYGKGLDQFLSTLKRRDLWRQTQRSSGAVCRQLGYASVILISAGLMYQKELSVGNFAMLLSLYNIVWNHAYIAENYLPLYKQAKAVCDRIVEILDSKDDAAPRTEEAAVEKIECMGMEEVRFGYRQDHHVLDHISLTAKAGEITCIAGYSGCGKSTIFCLLLGFLQPDEGRILVNHEPMTLAQRLGLRKKIGYVNQDCFLFNRSIKENLLYHVEENAGTVQAMNEYIEAFGLSDFLSKLPLGVETVLGEKSATISGGEKQRLCIIRELLKAPDILLLDECTSQIDGDTECKIMNLLRDLCWDKIVLQISHKSAVLENSDCIYILDQGRMIEQGPHTELIARSNFYRNLINYSIEV